MSAEESTCPIPDPSHDEMDKLQDPNPDARTSTHNTPPPRCRLLDLPAELRDQIWDLAVSDWIPSSPDESSSTSDPISDSLSDPLSDTPPNSALPSPPSILVRAPIRIDRFTHTPPTALTRTSSQIRHETLHRYYALNSFECWRPRFMRKSWVYSGSLVPWLRLLGAAKRAWLREVVLLHKVNDERLAEGEVEVFLEREGLGLRRGVVRQRGWAVGEEEGGGKGSGFEQLGLPRGLGERKRVRR